MRVGIMKNFLDVFITGHGKRRAQQGGQPNEHIQLVLAHSDRFVFVGKGCEALSVSNKKLKKLAATGILKPQLVEQLDQLVLVVGKADNNNNPPVVTVIPNAESHYTRNRAGAAPEMRKRRNKRTLKRW